MTGGRRLSFFGRRCCVITKCYRTYAVKALRYQKIQQFISLKLHQFKRNQAIKYRNLLDDPERTPQVPSIVPLTSLAVNKRIAEIFNFVYRKNVSRGASTMGWRRRETADSPAPLRRPSAC